MGGRTQRSLRLHAATAGQRTQRVNIISVIIHMKKKPRVYRNCLLLKQVFVCENAALNETF